MALDRVGSFVPGYNAYNIPPAKEPLQQPRTDVHGGEELQQKPQESQEPKKGLDLTVEVPSRENASIENVAISFGQYDSSSLDLYADAGLASRDMKQAISGMQKDRILHEYQYFVGGKDLTGKPSNIIAGTQDGIVIRL
jgi:hypothetical protein